MQARGQAGETMRRVATGLLVAVLVLMAAAAAAEQDSVDALVAQMDTVWQRRNVHGAIPDLVALGQLAHSIEPDNYEVEWRLARAYFWVAYTQRNRVAKKAMAGRAIESADRARGMRPERVEGHYFYAIAVGEYATTIGIVQALADGIAGKVETAATRAYEIDRDFYHGAPPTVLGRYYFMLPWPKRDLDRSRRYLEETVARHPQALIARDYLAETYFELGERDKAREQLLFVLANDAPPGTELDQPPPKTLAREAMQRWFSE
jgi:hypothetical protein